mmetsp:Transcript_43387/g.139456  ORF Transcript_43387/g.139456 Transcript_43387/m.139456 type:complete len:820 (-) Transcript_43387:114-2573(-)
MRLLCVCLLIIVLAQLIDAITVNTALVASRSTGRGARSFLGGVAHVGQGRTNSTLGLRAPPSPAPAPDRPTATPPAVAVAPSGARGGDGRWGANIPRLNLEPLRGGGSNQTAHVTNTAEISQVKLNSGGDGNALLSSLSFSFFTAGAFLLLFTLLRRWNFAVYAREGEVQAGASAATATVTASRGWIGLVLATSADEEVRSAGLDGWSLLEFYRFHGRVLLVIAPPILLVICPINYLVSPPEEDWLNRLDMGSMSDRPELLWLHAGFVWFVVIAVTWLLYDAHQDFLERRFTWLKNIPGSQATTILLENIPNHLRSDAALEDYFQGPNGVFMRDSKIVQNAYIVRRTKTLRQKWEVMQDTRKALDLATNRSEGAGPAPAEVVEALEESLKRQSEEVSRERAIVEKGVADKDIKVCAPYAFVTFSSALWQRLALKESFRADRTELVVSMPPDPDDVVYENLMDNVARSFAWFCLGWLCLVGVFLFWSPVVVFISSLTTLSTIRENVPWANHLLDSSAQVFPWFPAFLEGVLATAALRLFLAFLPFILFSIIRTFFPVKAGAVAQYRLSRWYFAFLLIFVLLVTTLGRGLVVTATTIADNPSAVINLLATWLPRSSHFYFNYMIFGWTTLTWELIRIVNLTKYWFYRVLYKSHVEEAKRQCEPEDEASFGLGSRMGIASLMSAMTLVCCTVSPLILVFAIVYFAIGRVTYGYLLVHVETKKPDLGGLFWMEAVQQVFFILALFVLLMTGVLAGQGKTYMSGPAAVAFSASLALYAMWYRINSFEWETLPLEQMAAASHAREEPTERERQGEYRQAECGTCA